MNSNSKSLKKLTPKQLGTTAPPLQKNDYVMIKQSRDVNKLFEVTDKNIEIDHSEGTAKMENKRGDMMVSIYLKDIPTLQFDAGTHLFLLYLLYELTSLPNNADELCVPFNNYMKTRGLKDKKSALEAACKYMAIIRKTGFSNIGENSYSFLNIADSGEVNSKVIRFKPTATFLKSLNQLNPLPTAFGIFQINPHKNPYCVYLLHKLLESKRENGDRIISVRSLVEGMNDLPTKEKELSNHRHITRNIIEPFERDMHALNWCFTWEYCGEKESNAPLDVSINYNSFINAYVKIYWLDYPDQTHYLKSKAKHTSKSKNNNNKK